MREQPIKEQWQIVLATAGMVGVFAVYEWAKTAIFPQMSLWTSHVVTTSVVGVITAITARYVIRRQAGLLRAQQLGNERLRDALTTAERTSNLLQSVLASIDEGLIIVDRANRVLLVNDASRRLLGLNRRPVEQLNDAVSLPQVHEAFASVLETGERTEARIEAQAGLQRRVLRLHAVPLRLHGLELDGVVGVFIDVSKLELLERIRQEFLANVSHELRTPLASISAYVETLIDGGLEDTTHSLQFLHTVQRNVERMRNLVNDISELSTIESGAVKLIFERLHLRELVEDIFTGLAHRSEEHQVHWRNAVPDDCFVTADYRRLEQILTNLIDNAIKFNRPRGEVVVSAVEERETEERPQLVIRVRDTGPGIPAKHLPRVFERFYRVDKARSLALGGTGLGLAIVKHLARAHGGEAEVRSEAGQGCEFIIKLPNCELPASQVEARQVEQRALPLEAGAPVAQQNVG